MPSLSTGDIFDAASRVELAVVFGHVGFNEMRLHWISFSQRQPLIAGIGNPFTDLAGNAIEWSKGRWLWFVEEQQNHGMTDEALASQLDTALSWASSNGLTSVATNGIANIDHGRETLKNRHSDEQRAAFLQTYASSAEKRYGISIELISMNDIFMRGQ